MIELYLDTADLKKISRFNQCLPLKGVTTNPSILAKSGLGLKALLPELTSILGDQARFHVQLVSLSVDNMVEEAKQLNALPYDLVVKIPATEAGLCAIKKINALGISTLATAIYSSHQGFMAALCGANYLAPYVNRIDAMGVNAITTVADLQLLLDKHQLDCKILAASFKNSYQAVEIMKLGVAAITLPVDIAEQMLFNPYVNSAVDQFSEDWQTVFGDKLSFQS